MMSTKNIKKERIPYLLFSLFSNLGILFFFKYFDFFLNGFNQISGSSFKQLGLILPMGISFYTFQTLAYTVDVYRGRISHERHLGKFALYVSFFPQLVAGPIERAEKLLPQLQKNDNKLNYNSVVLGLTQIIIGFYKKVVVADLAAIYVNSIYGNYELNTGFTLLLATYIFAIQIYCDFSGYSDIAIGCARVLGYDLMENFNRPYFSKSITEFWRRWHISLSTWLRDYLYIPLGGNRMGEVATYKNLIITMLLGGLWHGAAWNFIIWGALHGFFLSVERSFNYSGVIAGKSKIIRFLSGVVTFHLVCLSWIFFRTETTKDAFEIINRVFTKEHFLNINIQDTNVFGSILFTSTILILFEVFILKKLELRNLNQQINQSKIIVIQVVLFILILLFGVSEGSQFIYFQF